MTGVSVGYEWTQCWLQEPLSSSLGCGESPESVSWDPLSTLACSLLRELKWGVCVAERQSSFRWCTKGVPLRLSVFPDNTVKVCGYHDFSISIFPSVKEPMLQSRRPRLWVKWIPLVSNRTWDLNSFARLQSSHKEKKQQWKTHS